MKISDLNNIYIDNQVPNMESDIFKEGEILTGEILEFDGEEAIIYIKNFGKLKAFVEMELDPFIGEETDFLVKSSVENKIQLKPLVESIKIKDSTVDTSRKEINLIEVLDKYGIEKDPMAIEYVKNLIKYNMKLNEKNISFGIKVLEKLEQLLKVDEDFDSIINLKGNFELEKEDIRNLLIEKKDPIEEDEINKDKIDLLLESEDMEIEKKSLSKDMDEINPKLQIKENNDEEFHAIIKDLKGHMNILTENRDIIKSDLIKTIVIFLKYNIKPSVNNIKYFLELKENPHAFLEDLQLLEDIEYKKFTNIDKRAIIDNVGLKDIIEEGLIDYKETIREIEKVLKDNTQVSNKKSRGKIEGLQKKLEFLEEINHELNYLYIPLNFFRGIHKDSTIFIKDRKKKKSPKDNIIIFINLNTNNLGNVKINCQAVGDIINIKFNGLSNENIDFFKNREEKLINALDNTIYKVGRIEYESQTEYDILDLLIVNKDPIYHLNVGV